MTLNRLIFDYDQLLICGPVFPHEVAGFSGGAKYFFPGIAGAEIVNFTHWLGALVTSMRIIGVKDTPVRRVIHRAAEFVPAPDAAAGAGAQGEALHGLYIGPAREAWSAAADLSAQLEHHARAAGISARAVDAVGDLRRPVDGGQGDVQDRAGDRRRRRGDHLRAAHHRDLLHPRRADRRRWATTCAIISSSSGSASRTCRAASWRTARTSRAQGAYDAATRHRNAAHPGDAGDGHPRGALPAHQPGLRRLPRRSTRTEWAGAKHEGILLVPHAGEMLYRIRA